MSVTNTSVRSGTKDVNRAALSQTQYVFYLDVPVDHSACAWGQRSSLVAVLSHTPASSTLCDTELDWRIEYVNLIVRSRLLYQESER